MNHEWEYEWILNNPQCYDGPMHQNAVIQNIKKRHALVALNKKMTLIQNVLSTLIDDGVDVPQKLKDIIEKG
jgi:hypothetical protein